MTVSPTPWPAVTLGGDRFAADPGGGHCRRESVVSDYVRAVRHAVADRKTTGPTHAHTKVETIASPASAWPWMPGGGAAGADRSFPFVRVVDLDKDDRLSPEGSPDRDCCRGGDGAKAAGAGDHGS
jgi:hypothetical protein